MNQCAVAFLIRHALIVYEDRLQWHIVSWNYGIG